jgi:hypothetical protein
MWVQLWDRYVVTAPLTTRHAIWPRSEETFWSEITWQQEVLPSKSACRASLKPPNCPPPSPVGRFFPRWCELLIFECVLFFEFEHGGYIKFPPVDYWLFTQLNNFFYCARISKVVRTDWLSSSSEQLYIQLPELHNISKRLVFFRTLISKSPFPHFPVISKYFFSSKLCFMIMWMTYIQKGTLCRKHT